MPLPLRQAQLTAQQWAFYGVTIGTVVDTNDPQQMGRVRAVCLALNDDPNALITDIPWSTYATPFGGTVQTGTMGRNDNQVAGPVAYGMWGIPKIGSQALIMCLDGNPQTRIWIGCLHTSLATHTMPHGRFSYKTNNKDLPEDETPVGPISTFELNIEPLHTNLRTAFGKAPSGDENFEFQSRGADFQVSGLGLNQADDTTSLVEDDQDEKVSGSLSKTDVKTSRQGYQTSRIAPDQFASITGRNLDNTVTSIVSPGFHALSMDDRQENCRFRIRTTGGHQIIMDDTNERIYISTATGKNWIEMDEKGNIDIFTSGKLSVHAEHDINFTSERSIRMYGKAGIHLKSDQEVRVTAKNDISFKTDAAFRVEAGNNVLVSSAKDVHIKAADDILETTLRGTIHLKGNKLRLEGTTDTHLKGGTNLIMQGGTNASIKSAQIDLNGSAVVAESADKAKDPESKDAFFTNRIPDHEPWARSDTRADNTTEDLSDNDYKSVEVGKKRRITATDGITSETPEITRGKNWRR